MVEELDKLKRYLPKGYTEKLASEFGVTQMTIYNVLNGRTQNRFDIIKRTIELAKENISIQKELKGVVKEVETI